MDKRIKLASIARISKYFSRAVLLGAMFIPLSLSSARAAELVMFEQAGCEWCEAFDREIAPIYGKTEEGLRAPLRRVDTSRPLPPDLAFIETERLTPFFVLVDRAREIGRIRGYPGEENFWGLLGVLFKKLDATDTGGARVQRLEKAFLANNRARRLILTNWIAQSWNCSAWKPAATRMSLSVCSTTPSARAIFSKPSRIRAG